MTKQAKLESTIQEFFIHNEITAATMSRLHGEVTINFQTKFTGAKDTTILGEIMIEYLYSLMKIHPKTEYRAIMYMFELADKGNLSIHHQKID